MSFSFSYENILHFSNKLMADNRLQGNNADFINLVLQRLDDFFDLKTTCMASLSNSGERIIPSNFVTHNVSYAFLQKFLTSCHLNNRLADISQDINILSAQPNYKKSILYRDILQPSGYSDMIIQFIHPEGNRQCLSCIIYLSEKQPFDAGITALLDALSEPIANAHLDNINTNRLLCRISKLSDTMNYFPAGILYISAEHRIIQTNSIARLYLADFGITDPFLYDTFFTNHIYTYYMRAIRSHQSSLPLRIGDYLFSVAATASIMDNNCPAYQIFDSELNHFEDNKLLLNSVDNSVACIFIIHSEQKQVQFSVTSLTSLGLTQRETETAEFVAKGMNNKEIAEAMHLSENTIKTHLSNIYKKLGINYRAELIHLLHQQLPE